MKIRTSVFVLMGLFIGFAAPRVVAGIMHEFFGFSWTFVYYISLLSTIVVALIGYVLVTRSLRKPKKSLEKSEKASK